MPEARASACMASAPATSVSQAEGSRLLLMMLISVQGTTPKYSSMEVQHWMAEACRRLSAIQSSTTTPKRAMRSRAWAGVLLALT